MKRWKGFIVIGLCLLLERTSCAPQLGAFAQSNSQYVVKEQSVSRVAKVEINTSAASKDFTPKLNNGKVQRIIQTQGQQTRRIIVNNQAIQRPNVPQNQQGQITILPQIVKQIIPTATPARSRQTIPIRLPAQSNLSPIKQIKAVGRPAQQTNVQKAIVIQRQQTVQQDKPTVTRVRKFQIIRQQQPDQQNQPKVQRVQQIKIIRQQQPIQQTQPAGERVQQVQILRQQQPVQQLQPTVIRVPEPRIVSQPQPVQQIQPAVVQVQQPQIISQPQIVQQPQPIVAQNRFQTLQAVSAQPVNTYQPAQSQYERELAQYRQALAEYQARTGGAPVQTYQPQYVQPYAQPQPSAPYYTQQQQAYYRPTTGRSNSSGGSFLTNLFTGGLRALTGGLFG